MELYGFLDELCKLSEGSGETIVSQWNDAAIIIEPGDDPFTIYREVKHGQRGTASLGGLEEGPEGA